MTTNSLFYLWIHVCIPWVHAHKQRSRNRLNDPNIVKEKLPTSRETYHKRLRSYPKTTGSYVHYASFDCLTILKNVVALLEILLASLTWPGLAASCIIQPTPLCACEGFRFCVLWNCSTSTSSLVVWSERFESVATIGCFRKSENRCLNPHKRKKERKIDVWNQVCLESYMKN